MAGAGRMEDGRHISNMLAITLGTGVGSGIIINSKIYNGYGFAGGELGHTVLRLNGRQCTCGRKGWCRHLLLGHRPDYDHQGAHGKTPGIADVEAVRWGI